MDRRQALVVIVVLGAFIVVIFATAFISQQSDDRSGIQSQRFRASQAKQVSNPTPLYSKRQDRDEKRGDQTAARTEGRGGPSDSGEGTQQSPDLIAEAISESMEELIPDKPIEADLAPIEELSDQTESEGEAIAVEAAIQGSPQEGLDFLEAQIAVLPAMEASIEIYTTAATMYLNLDPPAPDAALHSLKVGASIAETPEERGEIALAYAHYLVDIDASDRAAAYLENALSNTDDFTIANVKAWLLLGATRQTIGADSAAIPAYLRARDDAASLLRTDRDAEGLYREACMRLARAYREQGDEESARRTAELMNEFLASAK